MGKKRWAYIPLVGIVCLTMTACGALEKVTGGTQEAATESRETEQATEQTEIGQTNETAAETEAAETKVQETEETESETEGIQWTVAVDAGHQGSWVDMSEQEPMAPGSEQTKAKATAGTTGSFSQVPEYEVNLQVSLVLRDELESRGYCVVMVREDNDTAISNKERAELATQENADISVRIHANGSEDASVSGALTMTPSASNPYLTQEICENSYKLSEYILDYFCGATGLGRLGVMATDEMTGINWSTVPVTILEMGFMTNRQDDLYITDESNHQIMAKGIADGIDAYFAEVQGTSQQSGTAVSSEGSNMTLLSEILEENYLNKLMSSGEKWSVAVRELASDNTCMVQAEESMQSASVIKAFIMAAVYERAVFASEAGKEWVDMAESYDGEFNELLTSMITVSDNEAANELVRRLGQGDFMAGAAIVNEFCQEHGYTATHLGRQFLAENPTDDNYTSAADCCKLLTEIYRGELINADASYRMLELLKQQTVKYKIPAGLPEGIQTANKTGEMPSGYGLGTIENDIAIVLDEQNPYVICILSNEIADNGTAQSTITALSREVYQYLSQAG